MYIICLSLLNVLVIYVKCYNLDFEYAVAKKGPKDSFFGFSVAEHRNTKKDPPENWILVGAPRANDDTLKVRFNNTGAVYKCSASDPQLNCKQVTFDDTVNGDDFNKANQWLGVSLKAGGENGGVVTCAHRYEFYGRSGTFRLLEGKCFALPEDMDIREVTPLSPCNKANLDTAQTSNHIAYGQCQSGIGLDILPNVADKADETNMVIGAAGTKWWSGEIFETDTDDGVTYGRLPDYVQADVKKNDNFEYRNSLFGYAVTHGNFLDKAELHIAVGGPRHRHFGKVLIYTQKVTNVPKKLKSLVQEIPANKSKFAEQIQIASGFGIALCAIDSDQDGLSELIIGAPFYLSQNGKERPERGIVYIFKKAKTENKLVLDKTIHGDEKHGSYSNFGYSVANAGDLNLDSYEDLVVGAPREEDNTGAIYIYFGTAKGLMDDFIQRIGALEVHSGLTDNIGLQGFGRSLGTGVDLDDNGYKDVLVGAYLSDKVILLRSRPIINVDSKLEFKPNALDSTVKCDLSKVSSCTSVKLCFNISEPSGKLMKNNQVIRVQYDIEADPIRTNVRRSRVKFTETGNNFISFIGNSSTQYKCQELGKLQLVYNEGSVIEYPDIVFRVSYRIPYTDGTVPKPARSDIKVVSLNDYPILKKDVTFGKEIVGTLYMTMDLNFKRNCSKSCVPDLKLTSPKKEYTLRLGKKDKEFNLEVENIGDDTAYSLGLEITLPSTLRLNDIILEGGTSVACLKNKCSNIINKFNKGEKRTIKVNLATDLFDPEGEKNISVLVTSANEEKPSTMKNNKLEILFDLKVEADLQLFTSQLTKSLSYEGIVKGETAMTSLEDAGPFITHTYTVHNNGPDMSPLANLTIYWPYETLSGKHLLYLVDIKSSGVCQASNVNVLNLKSDGSQTAASTASSYASTGSPSVDVQSSVARTKKRRVRRDTNNGTVLVVSQPSTQKKGILLNCTSARCLEIKCSLADIPAQRSSTVVIKSVLWRPSIILDYLGEELTVISNGRVIIGLNASYISDSDPDNQEQEEYTVITPIRPKVIEKKIHVWQIALAVVAGVILLGLMIFGLYKVGFFHRTRKHDENGTDQSLLNEKKGRQ